MYQIRTVFNYSANFNVVEETFRKQLIPPLPNQPAKQDGEKYDRGEGYQLGSLS